MASDRAYTGFVSRCLTGVLGSYYLNNSQYAVEVSALATYRPPQVTTIYADDGETVLAEFALEKRIPIKEQDIPKTSKTRLSPLKIIASTITSGLTLTASRARFSKMLRAEKPKARQLSHSNWLKTSFFQKNRLTREKSANG
jgi:hypothetical protein